MGARLACTLIAVVATAGGCADNGADSLPPGCAAGADQVQLALQRAPGAVALPGGVRVSRCFAEVRAGSDLQTMGFVLTRVADDLRLRAPTDDQAALRLGYLVGAARRGGARANGVSAELVRRLEQSATVPGTVPGSRRALARGLAAGEDHG